MFQPLRNVNIFVYLQSLQSSGFLWLDVKEDKRTYSWMAGSVVCTRKTSVIRWVFRKFFFKIQR